MNRACLLFVCAMGCAETSDGMTGVRLDLTFPPGSNYPEFMLEVGDLMVIGAMTPAPIVELPDSMGGHVLILEVRALNAARFPVASGAAQVKLERDHIADVAVTLVPSGGEL